MSEIQGEAMNYQAATKLLSVKGNQTSLVVRINETKVMVQTWEGHVLRAIWIGSRAELIKSIWPEGVAALDIFEKWESGECCGIEAKTRILAAKDILEGK